MAHLVDPVLRFAHYALLLGLFGWSAFPLVGLRSIERPNAGRVPGIALAAALAALAISVALMLMSIAAMMGLPLLALDRSVIEAMILGTDMGYAFLLRAGLLVAGLAAMLALGRRRAAMAVAAGCYAGALMTLGWSGHAAATEGGLGLFHRFNNGVHLLAAGLWLGAIGWFLGLTIRSHTARAQFGEAVLLAAMHRFAPLGITLVALVALTGIVNAQLIFGLPNSAAVLATPYGGLLAIKLVAVGAMLACGAYNARTSRALLGIEAGVRAAHREPALAALRRSLTGECLFGLAAIGLVAMLGTLAPMTM